MKGIVDCNNFYCSCERLFKPELERRPVVVLSNNDGCIISRSDEAKKLGVDMAGPYFKAKPLILQHNVAVFSSNYNLYGDLSWRVMETLRTILGKDRVEVYSVDEAFLDLDIFDQKDVEALAEQLKNTVELWTGIKVSVGIAPTKVLSKVANRLAKKNKEKTNCIMILDTPEKVKEALQKTAVEDVWGVGRQYAMKLRDTWGIFDAYQLSQMSETFGKTQLGGVVGTRLIKELKGETASEMKNELVTKKMIATTRMFGRAVTGLQEIKEAVATYISRAAEKLRRQHSAASVISVFIVAKEEIRQQSFHRGTTLSSYLILAKATSNTHELIKPALELAEKIFQSGRTYKKAGIVLSGIVANSSIQGNLFETGATNNQRKLMEMIDNINFSQRNDILKFAASGTKRNWKMRQELRSKRYTTRWNELFEIK
ncbi:MAG: Y-family DNA polymerase [Ferruginibacter sp.]